MAISHIQSLLVHAPNDNDPGFGDLVCPIHLTTTYKQEEFGKPIRYDYSRGGNPSRQVVEDQIAVLEGGNFCDYLYGDNHDKPFAGGLAFSSGMAAITAVLSLFNPGDEILVPGNLYGGTFRILDKYFARFGLRYRFVDFTNLKAVEQVFTDSLNTGNVGTGDAPSQSNSQASPLEAPNLPNPPKALLFESPTNPLLEVANIAALAKIAQQHGAITIVDNTFMSPYLQRPLQLGANIVIHSATKYLGGHSDVLAGLVAVNNRDLYERLHFIQYSTGATLSAFDSYLLVRGIKTLALRLDCACDNALKIAQFLDKNEQIAKVTYPGLHTDPGYAIQQARPATAEHC